MDRPAGLGRRNHNPHYGSEVRTWTAGILAVFAPLAVRAYRRIT
ncbi:hypothetical protein ACN26Z_01475 [Verrucosispora sp. WMMD703]